MNIVGVPISGIDGILDSEKVEEAKLNEELLKEAGKVHYNSDRVKPNELYMNEIKVEKKEEKKEVKEEKRLEGGLDLNTIDKKKEKAMNNSGHTLMRNWFLMYFNRQHNIKTGYEMRDFIDHLNRIYELEVIN